MGLPLYLARTRQEMLEEKSGYTAFMACHFSSRDEGLEPWKDIPKCHMVILNDRIPPRDPDPGKVAAQLRAVLEQTEATCVLLDLQRPGCPEALIKAITALPCPVGVTEMYAVGSKCPVFVENPMHRPLTDVLEKWPGRELWLDGAGNVQRITVTAEGAAFVSLPRQAVAGVCHRDEKLHCSYHAEAFEDRAEFTLFRTKEDIHDLLQEAERLGFTKAVGLYQELQDMYHF